MNVLKRIWKAIFYNESPKDTSYKISIPFIKESPSVVRVNPFTSITHEVIPISTIAFNTPTKDDFIRFWEIEKTKFEDKVDWNFADIICQIKENNIQDTIGFQRFMKNKIESIIDDSFFERMVNLGNQIKERK